MVTLPTQTLRDRSRELTTAEILLPEMQQFFIDMVPHMYEHDGIGLAAPQVGRNIRMCIIGKEAIGRAKRPEKSEHGRTDKTDLVLINPVFQKLSKKMSEDSEGCLSVPGFYGQVRRYKEIYVTALDYNGKPIEFAAHDFFARVIQHEIDHLEGNLFIDRAFDLYQSEHKTKLDPKIVVKNIKEIVD